MNGLITDIMFPNKYATWRNVEIKSFISEFSVDILVYKFTSYAGINFDFDWNFINEDGCLDEYNILIFDSSFNHLNDFNKRIDGTKFNGRFAGSYLLTKKTDFDIKNYKFVYHIFLMCYQWFNRDYLFQQSSQFIHLYPGGGLSDLRNIYLVNKDVNVISTHPKTTEELKKINHVKFIEVLTASFMSKNEDFFIKKVKKSDDYINICFSSLGVSEDKGSFNYVRLVDFYKKNFPDKKINFYSIGNCEKSQFIIDLNPMDYLSLGKFYEENIDIYINFETGSLFNGWPLGLESLIKGCVLITTDVNSIEKSYIKHNSGLFVVRDTQDVIDVINLLYKDKELIYLNSRLAQINFEKFLKYEHNQEKIFNYIRKK
jgi:glycosyltransferase involved in cell wall biosynthesis